MPARVSAETPGNGTKARRGESTVQAVGIDIEPIRLMTVAIEIEGETPLLIHKFSEKARKQIQSKQGSKAGKSTKKEIRKPEEEFEAARYTFKDEDGVVHDAVRSVAIKKAMIDAGFRYMGLVKADLRGDMHINSDLLAIEGPPPEMDEDVVRLSGPGRTADMRYRPRYWPWSIVVPITFKPDRLSEQQLVGMLDHAGFSGGLGENRPQTSGGNNGRFKVKELMERK